MWCGVVWCAVSGFDLIFVSVSVCEFLCCCRCRYALSSLFTSHTYSTYTHVQAVRKKNGSNNNWYVVRAIYLIFVCTRSKCSERCSHSHLQYWQMCIFIIWSCYFSFSLILLALPHSRLSLTVSLSVHRLPACLLAFLSFASPVLVLKFPPLIHLWVCVAVCSSQSKTPVYISLAQLTHFFRSLLHSYTLSLNHCYNCFVSLLPLLFFNCYFWIIYVAIIFLRSHAFLPLRMYSIIQPNNISINIIRITLCVLLLYFWFCGCAVNRLFFLPLHNCVFFL